MTYKFDLKANIDEQHYLVLSLISQLVVFSMIPVQKNKFLACQSSYVWLIRVIVPVLQNDLLLTC